MHGGTLATPMGLLNLVSKLYISYWQDENPYQIIGFLKGGNNVCTMPKDIIVK